MVLGVCSTSIGTTEPYVSSTEEGCGCGGAPVAGTENGSSSKDSPLGTASYGVDAEVDHPGGNATCGGTSSPGASCTRSGGSGRRAAKGR